MSTMNLKKLKHAEKIFFESYPGGFYHPDMLAMAKKHKMDKIILFTQESFEKENFKSPDDILDNFAKVINRSTMVSMFEKPKFKDFVKSLNPDEKELLVNGLKNQLHGEEQEGFEIMLEFLRSRRLAKWPLMTACPVYFRPQAEVFVKPTTVKGVIEFFELKSLQYKPAPTWAFYEEYRSIIKEMKSNLDPCLYPNNAAFSGFLMMSLENKN